MQMCNGVLWLGSATRIVLIIFNASSGVEKRFLIIHVRQWIQQMCPFRPHEAIGIENTKETIFKVVSIAAVVAFSCGSHSH